MMKLKFQILYLVILGIAGCAIQTRHIGGTYEPSLSNGYIGILSIELSESLSDVQPTMSRICSNYGGLKSGSPVIVDSPVGWKGFGNTYWRYQCNGLGNQNNQTYRTSTPTYQAPEKFQPKSSISIDEARQKCRDLGFKEGTETFGGCVLKLIK